MTGIDQAAHRAHGRMGTEVRTIAVLLVRQVDLEDGAKHHHRSRHRRPISNTGDAERALAAVRLRYPHTSHRLSSIRLPAECLRQFTQPPLFPVRLDVRKVLPVHPRCACIGLAAPIRVLQNIFAIQLVVQQIEAIVRRFLRFRL